MAKVSFGSRLSLQQAATIIAYNPERRFLVEGEPGIGKSAMLPTICALRKQITGRHHNAAYIDVPTKDLGDLGYPVMDHERKVACFYPNAAFRITEDDPVVIMLDEFTKGMEPIKNMLHPLLEVNNPRLGDARLPKGSMVFMTGNLTSDGVGDSLKAHSRNRIVRITVNKPDAKQWLSWAANNDIDATVMAWIDRYPHALASYLDEGQSENPYIYNPKKVMLSFVTPRSLEIGSGIITERANYDEESLVAGLAGCIGEAAARDLQAFIAYQDQLPSWEEIIRNPKKAPVPESPGACAVQIFGAIAKIDKQTMAPFMEYLNRFESEWQACFAINITHNPVKQAIAFSNQAFTTWVQENLDLL